MQKSCVQFVTTLLLVGLLLANSKVFAEELSNQELSSKELDIALKYALLPKPVVLKPFQLDDQNGAKFGLDSLKGKWTFLYFGYTSCPDICPMTTDELNIVSNKLANNPKYKQDTQFIFVSVDPYRDTAMLLKQFTSYYDFNLIGAVAPVEELNKLTDQLGVFHRRLIVQDRDTKQQEYVVEHNADIYLIDPNATFMAKFATPHYGKEIERLYVKIRELATP